MSYKVPTENLGLIIKHKLIAQYMKEDLVK